MQILLGFICFSLFLYSLYTLGKDDYLLIRKNLSLEQLFDFAFIGLFAGVLLAKILSVLFYPTAGKNFFSESFSPFGTGILLIGIIAGCFLPVYFIGKYRKLPLGRLFDFFSLAFLSFLPFGYLITILFVKQIAIFYYLVPGIFYFVIGVFFWKFLLPRIMSNKLKDGSICLLFLLLFSLVSFLVLLFYQFFHHFWHLMIQDFFFLSLFLACVVFMLQNEKRKGVKGKK